MHAKRNHQKKKKENIDVLLLFLNSAASQRYQKYGNSNFLFVNVKQPFKLVCQLWYTIQKPNNMSTFSVNLSTKSYFYLVYFWFVGKEHFKLDKYNFNVV